MEVNADHHRLSGNAVVSEVYSNLKATDVGSNLMQVKKVKRIHLVAARPEFFVGSNWIDALHGNSYRQHIPKAYNTVVNLRDPLIHVD
jgi:hypothetical protein